MTTSAFMLVRTLCSLALASTLFLAGCGQQPIVHTHSHTSGLGRPSSPTCTTAASATAAAEAFVQPGETVKSVGSDALGTMVQGRFANTPDFPDNYFYFFVYASNCHPDMAVGAISAATYLGIVNGEFVFSVHPVSTPTVKVLPYLIRFDPVFGVSYFLYQDATVGSSPDIVDSNGPHLLGGRFTFSRSGQSLLLNLTLSPAKQYIDVEGGLTSVLEPTGGSPSVYEFSMRGFRCGAKPDTTLGSISETTTSMGCTVTITDFPSGATVSASESHGHVTITIAHAYSS